MNRKFVGGLLITFFILFILVIISLFIDFGKTSITIYTIFIGELFYLTWVATRKISVSSPLRKFIGAAILSFIPLLILTIISLFTDIGFIEKIIYFLFGINFIFLLVLFIRRSIRNISAKRAGKEVEKENLFEKITKYIVYLIPVVIFGYVIWLNFNPFTETIVYDIGGEGDEGILYPVGRVSNPMMTDDHNINYRELKDSLVYFDIPISISTKSLEIKFKFKDNFPENSIFRVGAKDSEEWHYEYKTLYDNRLKDKIIYTLQDYQKIPENSLVYIDPKSNFKLENIETKLEDYIPKKLVIDSSIRGSHTILIYVKGDLEFQVFKQDLNWYEGTDELKIELYKNNNLIKSMVIPDDGIIDNLHKITNLQERTLSVKNLEEGVYRIELINNNADVLIKKIITNQNKLVFKSYIFLAGDYYLKKNEQYNLYFKNYKKQNIKFMTFHSDSLQEISIKNKKIKIEEWNKWFNTELVSNDEYVLSIPKGDITVESNNYFSFSKNSYFIPYKFFITKNLKNSDYVITNKIITKENGWIISNIEFDIDKLHIKENKLNFILSMEQLSGEKINYTLPLDWIKIKIKK